MELVCLCCLAESEFTYTLDAACEFRPEECQDDIPSASIRLSEIYTQLMQVPLLPERLDTSSRQPVSNELCSLCVEMLKNFYLFRLRALKSYEELQTKAKIANIICHLEQSSVGSARSERLLDENIGVDVNLGTGDIQRAKKSSDEWSNGSFRCSVCDKVFKMRKLLLRHEEIHQQEKRHHCQYCNKTFVAKASCYNHELRVHGHRKRVKKPDKAMTKTKHQKDLISHETPKSQASKVSSMSKERSKTEKKQYTCDLCPKIFTRQSSLNDHKMVLHAGIRQYSCHICSRAFGKENSLKTHMSLHLGKNHRCKLCGKAFAKASFLRKHLEEHESPDEVRKYNCPVCFKKFTAKSHLTDHERIHGDKRPFKCNVCGDSFRQKQQLKVHNYQHVGKPFRCEECNVQYGSRSRLQAHMEKNHREVDGQTLEPNTIAQPDFGDKVVNEELLNEICYQIDSNPIILQNIAEADGVNLICNGNEQIVFFADDALSLLPDIMEQCL